MTTKMMTEREISIFLIESYRGVPLTAKDAKRYGLKKVRRTTMPTTPAPAAIEPTPKSKDCFVEINGVETNGSLFPGWETYDPNENETKEARKVRLDEIATSTGIDRATVEKMW